MNISLEEEYKVVEINLKMDQVSVQNKIYFHKQANEVLYHDLMQSTLKNKKMENKVIKLEEELKKEKVMSKAWHTRVKKFEIDLIEFGVKSNEKKPIKNLINEKEKTTQSLKTS